MRQRFFAATEPNAAATAATVLAQTGDVYVGCAPRAERTGHKQAVPHAWVLWVDCDDPRSIAALERFEPQPAIVVRTSGRGRHAYWPLDRPLSVAELERANRRLAHALGADPACADAARILRPPATLKWKYEPPSPVTLERFTGERLDPDQVTGALPDPPQTRPCRPPGEPSAARAGDPLLAIDPAVYVARADRPAGGPRRQGRLPVPPRPHAVAARLPRPGRRLDLLDRTTARVRSASLASSAVAETAAFPQREH